MFNIYGVLMILCVIAMIVGLFFYVFFQIFFWEDDNLIKSFTGLGLYIWFGFCFGSWLGTGCPVNWYLYVSAIAALMILAQFCFFKKRWQAFYAQDRPFKKVKRWQIILVTVLTLCVCGAYGYCSKQLSSYRHAHAEVYTVVGFNPSPVWYKRVHSEDEPHLFVVMENSSGEEKVIVSEKYHLGDTIRIFNNKLL